MLASFFEHETIDPVDAGEYVNVVVERVLFLARGLLVVLEFVFDLKTSVPKTDSVEYASWGAKLFGVEPVWSDFSSQQGRDCDYGGSRSRKQ